MIRYNTLRIIFQNAALLVFCLNFSVIGLALEKNNFLSEDISNEEISSDLSDLSSFRSESIDEVTSTSNLDEGSNSFTEESQRKTHNKYPSFKIQDWSQSNFKHRKNITIDNTKVSGSAALINFPVLINLNDSDLRTEVQTDGDDIIFTDVSGTQLDHEIEVFDQSFNSTHAQLVTWVRVPSLSATVDTTITMYYGNSTIGSQENPTGVWNNNYNAVWHLNQNVFDSTTNNNDGTNFGSSDIIGKIANGQNFDGIDDYIEGGSDSSLDNLFASGGVFMLIMMEVPQQVQ
jgi:hypothetical protein